MVEEIQFRLNIQGCIELIRHKILLHSQAHIKLIRQKIPLISHAHITLILYRRILRSSLTPNAFFP